MPIMVAAYTVGMLIEAEKGSGTFDRKWIGYSILLILVLIGFRFLFDYLRARFQEAIGYELIARDRLAVGDALKRVSLGYFQQMNTGNILSSITTGLGTLETMGIRMIDSFIGGYLNFLVVFICLCVCSPLTALIALAAAALSEAVGDSRRIHLKIEWGFIPSNSLQNFQSYIFHGVYHVPSKMLSFHIF